MRTIFVLSLIYSESQISQDAAILNKGEETGELTYLNNECFAPEGSGA